MPSPNLLFLYTDEQRADTLAAYGNRTIAMPNLNRLASRSTVFARTYVTQPVCTPSRSTLLTGLWPHTNTCTVNNAPLPAETPCLSEMLPDGYTCAHHGKWHLGDEIYPQHGFTEWRAIEDNYVAHYSAGRDRADRSHYHHWLRGHGFLPDMGDGRFSRNFCTRIPERYSKPAFLAEEACRFLRENRSRPFALYVNFLEPHMPFMSCRDEQYAPEAIDLPANFDHQEYPSLRARVLAARFRNEGPGGGFRTEADWRRLIARYWGLCSLVDTHVGRILATLSECGLDENTIVVYTSDHGDMMGSHRLMAKCLMYEEAVRVPFLVRLPGQTAGRHVAQPVSQLDIVPTLLDCMGVSIPDRLQGQSLRPCLEGKGDSGRDVFIEWHGAEGMPRMPEDAIPAYLEESCTAQEVRASFTDPVRTIVTRDGWKYCCSPLGEHMLYDLNRDPAETCDLATDPSQAPRLRDLRARLAAWQEQTQDTVELPDPANRF